jgi:hypothetical protein
MPVFQGSISGTESSVPKNIASTINSFSIVNGSGGNADVTVYIENGVDTPIPITAIEYTLKDKQAYIRDSPILILPNYYITIVSTGTVYYYFSIS